MSVQAVFSRMPARQQKAGKYLAGFFAVVLGLTLLSRGLDSLTIPTVATTAPFSGTVGRKITVNGTVEALGGTAVFAPQGHLVESVLVEAGTRVEEGDVLATLSLEDLEKQLAAARRALEKARLDAQLKQVKAGTAQADPVESAQTALERAQADLERTVKEGEEKVRQALEDVSDARSYRSKLRKEDAEDGEMRSATLDLDAKRRAAEDAVRDADRNEETARRAVEDAERALDNAHLENGNTAAQDEADAQTTALENRIAALELVDLQQKVAELEELAAAEGKITAPRDGLVGEIQATPGSVTGGGGLLLLEDLSGGALFRGTVSEKEGELLSRGDEGTLSVRGQGSLQGAIGSLAPPEEKGGDYKLTVLLPDGEMEPGSATFTVEKQSERYSQVVPVSALYARGSGDASSGYVYVVRERDTLLGVQQVVERVEVEILEQNGTVAAVSGVFDPEDRVVKAGSRDLATGDRVRVEAEG